MGSGIWVLAGRGRGYKRGMRSTKTFRDLYNYYSIELLFTLNNISILSFQQSSILLEMTFCQIFKHI